MLVEFIGAAGTGKSFLSERVLDELHTRRIAARNFDLIEINRAAPRNLYLGARSVCLSVMTKPKSPSRVARAAGVIARYSIRREICERAGGMYITSEGLFHRIITLHRNSRSLGMAQLADMLFRRIQPPDMVVVLQASADKVFARRRARNRVNDIFSHVSVAADIAIVEESIDAILQIKRTLHPPLQILKVLADEDGGEQAVADISSALELHAGAPA